MNFYDRLKENFKSEARYGAIELFNENAKFVFKNMWVKVLILTFALTLIPILPYLIKGDFKTIISEGVINLFERMDVQNFSPASVKISGVISALITFIVFILQSYFNYDYFLTARRQKLEKSEYASRFFKGILKLCGAIVIFFVAVFVITLISLLLMIVLKWLMIVVIYFITIVMGIFMNLVTQSIFDDPRISFGDALTRAKEVFFKKEYVLKVFFSMLLSILVGFTINSAILILPESSRLIAVIIGSLLNNLFALIVSSYTTAAFIQTSDHVKYYLYRPYALEYGYDPYENTFKDFSDSENSGENAGNADSTDREDNAESENKNE